MSQSLSCLLVHLIFSTKERHPFLAQNDLMLRTHAYLGGILREASCPSLGIERRARRYSAALSALNPFRVPGAPLRSTPGCYLTRPSGFQIAAFQAGYENSFSILVGSA